MRPALLTTVAAAALSLGIATAMAQSGAPGGGPAAAPASPAGGAGGAGSPASPGGPAASGAGRPAAASTAPGRSDAAPGRSGGDASASSAPGRSETAPGPRRGETARTAPGGSDTPPGRERAGGSDRERAASEAGDERQRGADRDRQRANQERGDRNQRAGSDRDRDQDQAASEERGRDRQQAGSERDRDRRQQAGSERDRDQAGPERDRDRQRADGPRDEREQRAGPDGSDRRQDSAQSRDSATGGLASARVSEEKRTEIRETLVRRDVEPVRNVNFSISVGVSVPERVRVYELPPSVVEVVPQYRGYRYTVVEDEIVIINPRTRQIVEVIDRDLSGSRTTTASVSSGGALRLSREQRTTVTRSLRAEAQSAIRVGGTAPSCVELSAVPQRIVAEVPELKSYRYFAIGEEVVIVEPESRRIVEIIE